MFLTQEFPGFPRREEPKRSVPSKSSKGYPERRDPAAERPSGVLNKDLDEASLRKLRQRYAPSGPGLYHQ